jgi:hypothetical protein
MKTKLFTIVSLVLALVFALVWTAGAASADTVCDPAYVTQSGNVISVRPAGVDDTANLQCAFDAAVSYGEGAHVQLQAGTFHTGQVVINDFQGTFTGAGMNDTEIVNLPNLYVTPVDMYLNPPSASNPWPSLFSFVDGDYHIADLAIRITSDHPTAGWTIFGISPPVKELALAIAVLGDEAHVRVDRVLIEGEPMENSLYGYNLINGIYMEGFMGELPWPPISGSLEVYNSVFKHLGAPVPLLNLENATVVISRNRIEDVFDASDASDLVDSNVTFSHNQVDGAFFGYWYYPGYGVDSEGSKILIKNNVFRESTYGLYFEGVLGPGNECLMLGNNVQDITDIGIYLGPDVEGCTVVGGGNNVTNVVDEGTNNILTGVNNMGLGIGPDISQFLRKKP